MIDNDLSVDSEKVFERFQPAVRTWFTDVFASPTSVQNASWKAISAGENALVVAPTGSGKTLAAFLWSLNELSTTSGQTTLAVANNTFDPASESDKDAGAGVKVLYISPLKALGVDVERNLRAPLIGIARTAANLGLAHPTITVGVRSGDTPAAERAAQLRNPPDILITTPESAYLMLTSKARGILTTVRTVIIDEIHAIAGSKRGVHLALSLERLERLIAAEGTNRSGLQRIGLSATVRPIETVAQFLGGDRPVQIINPPATKSFDLVVRVPVEDMSDLPTLDQSLTANDELIDDSLGLSSNTDETMMIGGDQRTGSIWPHIEAMLYDEVMDHRSTIIFVNSRRSAEKLAARLNELYVTEHSPEVLETPAQSTIPAQVMPSKDAIKDAGLVIARAHHGSVSKDERATTETMLKEGALRAVVSTSSLELGIDMGAVDLVIQVEAPPSVASGLQRVGRAGHVVGAVSHGSFYPKHRSDLVQTAVTVKRMRGGHIEALHIPRNPLDVLVQQTVAQVAVEDIDVEEWYATVIRAFPYRTLPREVYDAVLDLASGVYPSTDFAELKPRIVYDRITGTLSARPGAQRVAVTSGGTIPDRGLFGVYLVGGEVGARRVGELDEEMVYESRVGDVFTLGASSWRIEEITRDQVLVSPAPGHSGRLPFWVGDQLGRPAELGKAVGAFRREIFSTPQALEEIATLDHNARENIVRFLQEQHEATGVIPDERTFVLERFRDDLGDWRVVLHTPFGRGVNAAWALAVGSEIAQRTGIDAQAVSSDDGIVLRLPDADVEPGAELFLIDPDAIEHIVTEQVGNSALFASRFRECAARALLLPRRHPGKRAPLWQQRQRAAQLLDVARKYPTFPIILEAVRECLQDVYDLPSLVGVLEDLKLKKTRIVEITTEQPSPFAASILFSYTGAFVYEGDSPLAEKRAAALALDPALLAKLMGTVELRELLEPEIIAEVDAQLRRISTDRQARNPEEFIDALRILGPIADLNEHISFDTSTAELLKQFPNRIMQVRINGLDHLAQVADAAVLRDGLGVPVPRGVGAQIEPVTDALDQLVARWARTRGPFVLSDLQNAFGLAASVAFASLEKLMESKAIIAGHYRKGIEAEEYIASEVLRIIRSKSLAKLRSQTAPVSPSAFARFLSSWHQVAAVGSEPELYGVDGVYSVIEQLAGVRLPASAWEEWIFPNRVRNYNPADLDELTYNGEVLIIGQGKAGAGDPWLTLVPAAYADSLITDPSDYSLTDLQESVLTQLGTSGSHLYQELRSDALDKDLREALWGLFELGLVSPDSFRPIRARLAGGKNTAHRAKRTPNRSRGRFRGMRSQVPTHTTPPDMVGRWGRTIAASTDATSRAFTLGETLLDRYGVVTRGSAMGEDIVGGFALVYKVLKQFEESGKAMRGHLIEGMGATQFSTPAIIDRLRGYDDSADISGWPSGAKNPEVVVLAAADPANPYGAAIAWPERGLTRAAGSLVVLIDGLLAAYMTRGGKNLILMDTPEPAYDLVINALGEKVRSRLVIEKVNGDSALESPLLKSLKEAGLSINPRGLVLMHQPTPRRNTRGRPGRSLDDASADLSFDD
ncbi:ATP-dependent helicase [Corynebacterium sp. ES2775-CONJ]|nr:ATP-dependent helicase [Corynebacterium sp. ES2775-CONJ]